jgi:hypothetical protein
MSWLGCSRLDEVRQALAQGHWPQACAPELRAHVEGCVRCAQEVLLAEYMQVARNESVQAARPGAASLLWWRAQTRRRNAALERAGRPLAAAQIFALAVVLAVVAGLVAAHWHEILERAASAQAAPAFSFSDLLGSWGPAPVILAIALIATLGSVVVYLTTERQ